MNAQNSLTACATDRSDDAFRQFVARYANLVFSIAKRRLGNPSLAEDVTQSVFIRIAQTPPPSRDEPNLVAWLHRVTTNAAIDAWRAESRRREREQAAILMQTDTATFSDHDHEHLAENLDEALNALREPDRQAILLRYFRGHRIAEVGRLLGISEDAAKMRIHRALDALRENLSARGVTCASPILLAFLMDRSVEAAPATLASTLANLNASAAWAAPATSATFSIGLALKVLVAILLLGGAVTFLVSRKGSVEQTPPPQQQIAAPAPQEQTFVPLAARPATPPAENIVGEPLTVVVVDSLNNKPIPGARISGPYWGPGGVTAGHLRATTTAEGFAEFPPLSPSRDGSVNLFVTAPNYVPVCFRWKTKKAPHFTAPLDRAQTVAGIILDEQGIPISGATIRLRGPSADHPEKNIAFHHDDAGVASLPDGRFTYPFAPRDWTALKFRLTKEDYTLTDIDLAITNQNLSELKLVLKSGAALTGFVTTEDGAPILGATVREMSNWGSQPPNGTTDASGAYMLRGLANHYVDRNYKVIVLADGFRPEIRELKLSAPTNHADFKLSKGIRFHGRVIDQAGNPIPGAVVRTDSGSDGLDPYKWIGHTDSEGRFDWNSAPAEEIEMWFEATGYITIRNMRITPDNNPRDITLEPGSPAR